MLPGIFNTAQAAIYYWDTDGTTAGFGTASGTWGTDPFWSTSTTGTATPAVINPTTADALNFGFGPTGLAAGTINVGTVNSGDLTFASGTGALVLAGGTITLAPAANIMVNNASNTISSVLAGAGTSFTKSGTGTLILNGSSANTYTGGTRIVGGRLTLDFANLATPTNLINSSSVLTLGNGTLSVIGKSTGTTTQTFASTTLNSGLAGLVQGLGGGTSTTVNLGVVTRNVGAIFDLAIPPSATLITNVTSVNGITPGGSDKYLGGWAVYGTGTSTRFVQMDTAGNLKAGPSGTAPGTDAVSMTNPALVYTVNTAYTPVGNTAALGLNLNGATTFNLNGVSLTVSGMIQTNTTLATFGGTGGSVVIGADRELAIHMTTTSNVVFSVPIVNNGAGASNLTVGSQVGNAPTGAVQLNAVNTYTGLTTVNGGVVTLGIADALNSASGIVMNGGTLGTSSFNQNVNSLKLAGGTITGSTGVITSATTYDLQGGSISAILGGAGIAAVKSTNDTVTLSGNNTYTGGLTLNEGTLRIHNDSTASTGSSVGTGTLTLSGGILTSSASNASTIARIPNATVINGNVQLGTSDSNRAFQFTSGVTINNNPTITLAALVPTTGVVTIQTAPLTLNSNATLNVNQPLTISSGITAASSRVLTINAGTTAVILGGPLALGSSANSVTLAGTGSNVTLTATSGIGGLGIDGLAVTSAAANTYNGATTITSGSLSFTGSGSINSSSAVTLGAAGTLSVVGITPTSYALSAAQPFTFVLDPTGLGSAGLLNATGKTLNITNGQVTLNPLATLDDPVYVLANYGTLTGANFATVTGLPSGYNIDYNYLGGSQIAIVAIPEPGTLTLMALAGCAGLVWLRRKQTTQG